MSLSKQDRHIIFWFCVTGCDYEVKILYLRMSGGKGTWLGPEDSSEGHVAAFCT